MSSRVGQFVGSGKNHVCTIFGFLGLLNNRYSRNFSLWNQTHITYFCMESSLGGLLRIIHQA